MAATPWYAHSCNDFTLALRLAGFHVAMPESWNKGYFSFPPLTNTEALIPHPISRRPHLPTAVSPVSPGQGSGDRSLRDALKKVMSDHADEASNISL